LPFATDYQLLNEGKEVFLEVIEEPHPSIFAKLDSYSTP